MAPRALTFEALEKLEQYGFPGNLRELRNLIERAYILSRNPEIEAPDLPIEQKEARKEEDRGARRMEVSIPLPNSFDLTNVLERTERELILKTLTSTKGAQAEAARRMGLSRSALAYKLSKYGIRSADNFLVTKDAPGIARAH